MSLNSTLRTIAVTQRATPRSLERRVLNNRYVIEYAIGSGGMSHVLAAKDLLLDRTVAIKILRKPNADSADLERLRREAAALAAVESPHVVPIFDVGVDGTEMYLVMQFVRGITLAEEIERFGPMTPVRACRITRDILAGLCALHRGGLVHRDLKPANVMLDRDDRAVLLDLGIALHRRRRPLTPPGMAAGTPGFMAPEQSDSGAVDSRTDLYQVGRILQCLLTGVDAEQDLEVALCAVPPALHSVVRRALAPIGRRFATSEEMMLALDLATETRMPEPMLAIGSSPGLVAPSNKDLVSAPQGKRRERARWPALTLEVDREGDSRDSRDE